MPPQMYSLWFTTNYAEYYNLITYKVFTKLVACFYDLKRGKLWLREKQKVEIGNIGYILSTVIKRGESQNRRNWEKYGKLAKLYPAGFYACHFPVKSSYTDYSLPTTI